MACFMRCSKGIKICCGVTAILITLLIVILVVLFLTVLKPKDPTINLQSVQLDGFRISLAPLELNVSLGIVVRVDNPNPGSFSYQNSTAYVNYRGNLLAEAPLYEDTIPSRGAHNISTSLNIFADNYTKIQDLPSDFLKGVINFTSTTTLTGKVKVLNLFRFKATSYSTCDISLFILEEIVNSTCIIQIKL
ncbi:uncharacterized protein LOC133299205 [Gastrolobium bilobum]|uniref:uncharacterized protein LOC133299205 n=1 Tax=Gastrolobium bilobum TaxID=150636 RepID=UPI002AB21972|nr:uncharacterized protein LOC133299205 [Gastrolobium bilobum]